MNNFLREQINKYINKQISRFGFLKTVSFRFLPSNTNYLNFYIIILLYLIIIFNKLFFILIIITNYYQK